MSNTLNFENHVGPVEDTVVLDIGMLGEDELAEFTGLLDSYLTSIADGAGKPQLPRETPVTDLAIIMLEDPSYSDAVRRLFGQ